MAALIAPLTLTSCSDDFLDVTPPDKATLQEYYSNKEHIMEAVASTYNPMRQYDWNNVQYAPLQLCSDIMADDVWVGGGTSSDNLFLQKMSNYASTQNPGDALTGIWDQSYKGIRNANDVLTYIEWAKAALTQADYNTFMAEAKVLRAFYYMQVWKFYGNIPFYFENLKSPYIGEQKSADEVYKAVISDLESAIGLNALPMKWDDKNLGRMSQAAAYMIYAEMVMYQNDESRYAKALGYARDYQRQAELRPQPRLRQHLPREWRVDQGEHLRDRLHGRRSRACLGRWSHQCGRNRLSTLHLSTRLQGERRSGQWMGI